MQSPGLRGDPRKRQHLFPTVATPCWRICASGSRFRRMSVGVGYSARTFHSSPSWGQAKMVKTTLDLGYVVSELLNIGSAKFQWSLQVHYIPLRTALQGSTLSDKCVWWLMSSAKGSPTDTIWAGTSRRKYIWQGIAGPHTTSST